MITVTMKSEQQYERKMSRSRISLDNIKYDLLKIAEPYDGVMFEGSANLVEGLFLAYLRDLRYDRVIFGYELMEAQYKENAVTFDVMIQLTNDRNSKKIKVHVGTYKSAWPRVKAMLKH